MSVGRVCLAAVALFVTMSCSVARRATRSCSRLLSVRSKKRTPSRRLKGARYIVARLLSQLQLLVVVLLVAVPWTADGDPVSTTSCQHCMLDEVSLV